MKSWFRNLLNRLHSGRWQERKCNDQFDVWDNYSVSLDISVAGEWRADDNFSLEANYFISQPTRSKTEEMETISSLGKYLVSAKRVKAVNQVLDLPKHCNLCGNSSKSTVVTVSSCPSRIQSHGWFFPTVSDGVYSVAESETEVESERGRENRDGKAKDEWTWFPGDDEFRDRSPDNSKADIKNGNSFPDGSSIVCNSKHGPLIKDEDILKKEGNRLGIAQAYDLPRYNDIWIGDNKSEEINDSVVSIRDPTQLVETERMLTNIIFESQAKEDAAEKPSSTYPIVIEHYNIPQNQEGDFGPLEFDNLLPSMEDEARRS